MPKWWHSTSKVASKLLSTYIHIHVLPSTIVPGPHFIGAHVYKPIGSSLLLQSAQCFRSPPVGDHTISNPPPPPAARRTAPLSEVVNPVGPVAVTVMVCPSAVTLPVPSVHLQQFVGVVNRIPSGGTTSITITASPWCHVPLRLPGAIGGPGGAGGGGGGYGPAPGSPQ